MTELPSDYHRRLPYGERMSAEPLLGGPFFPFEGDVQVVPLAEPVLPEPPRRGEPGGDPCPKCADPDGFVIWRRRAVGAQGRVRAERPADGRAARTARALPAGQPAAGTDRHARAR